MSRWKNLRQDINNCHVVGKLVSWMRPLRTLSRINWLSSSICLVCSCKIGLRAICNADWLSQCRVTDLRLGNPNSSKSLTTQVSSDDAVANALYSTSKDDLDIIGSFFDFQFMGDHPKRKMYPIMDCLELGQDTQSESEKGWIDSLLVAFNKIPYPAVEWT